ITLERALELCSELKELGTREVTLIGGEPLLSEKWFPIAKKLGELEIKVNFVSNAVLVDGAAVAKLKQARINNFGVSIEGTRATNDSIRGTGVYDKILRAIRLLHSNGVKVSVATTISKLNYPELDAVYFELVKLGVKVWQIQLAMPVGRMTQEAMLEKKDLRSLIEFIIRVNEEGKLRVYPGCNIGYFGGLEEKYRTHLGEGNALPFWTGCYSGIFEMGLTSDGSVKGCLAMKDKFIEGNINQKPLKEIWESENAFAYNRKFKRSYLGGFCANCPHGEVCRGGCPIVSEALTGSMNNDPYCLERIENEARAGKAGKVDAESAKELRPPEVAGNSRPSLY
ncbi:MAG: radical SAM protein, partial [Candidatus Micrarchaeota archaeon]